MFNIAEFSKMTAWAVVVIGGSSNSTAKNRNAGAFACPGWTGRRRVRG
jgi:hypothetical protein